MRRFGLIFRFGLMFHTVLTCQVRHRSASHHLPHLTDPSKTALRSASLGEHLKSCPSVSFDTFAHARRSTAQWQ
jgi:hypothetical protein